MIQSSLLSVTVLRISPSASVGLDGADLKWVAYGDDGNEYAMKTLDDHPLLPLTEWVCYRLWRACGLAVPECAILTSKIGLPPAFGSRLDLTTRQLPKKFDALTIASTFGPHKAALGLLYPLDAFLPNPDRHGRNVLLRPQLMGESLVSIDFSRAWAITGEPFGDPNALTPDCHTTKWWRYLRDNLQVQASFLALDKVANLPDNWMSETLAQTPTSWQAGIDLEAVSNFWKKHRPARTHSARMWL